MSKVNKCQTCGGSGQIETEMPVLQGDHYTVETEKKPCLDCQPNCNNCKFKATCGVKSKFKKRVCGYYKPKEPKPEPSRGFDYKKKMLEKLMAKKGSNENKSGEFVERLRRLVNVPGCRTGLDDVVLQLAARIEARNLEINICKETNNSLRKRYEQLAAWRDKIRLLLTSAKNVGYCKVRKGRPIQCPLERICEEATKELEAKDGREEKEVPL